MAFKTILTHIMLFGACILNSLTTLAIEPITRKDTVIFDIGGGQVENPELWNPYVRGSRLDQGLHQAMIEPLFILNYETGELVPWLAEGYEHNSMADQWTLKLRQGIHWSDGESMDADDVIFTINLVKSTPEMVNADEIGRWVKQVHKVDSHTIRFDLTGPNPRFVLDHFAAKIFGRHNILPEHIWRGKDSLTFTNYAPEKGWPVFTGPYTLHSVSKTRFVYLRDDNWWGAKAGFKPLPKPKQLIWNALGPEETRTAAMANQDLDSLMDISLDAFFALQTRNTNVMAHYKNLPYSWPDPCARNIELNHEVAPWNDKEMRWALNHAIHREEIVEEAYKGATVASQLFFPAYRALDGYVEMAKASGLYDQYPLLKFDPHKAKQIIESKGYTFNTKTGYYEKDGKELSIHIQTPEPFVEKHEIARIVVRQWQRVGINATWGNVNYGTFWKKFFAGDYEARTGWQTCGSVNEPWASLNTFNIRWYQPIGERIGSASQNGWRWRNQAYSNIVDEMGKLPLGDPKVGEHFVEAMKLWMDELPLLPVTQAKKIIPFNTTYWTNWPTAENPYIHPPTWWQSTHMIIHNLKPSERVVENKKETFTGEVRVVTSHVPPFSYEENDEVKGLSTEVVQAILKELGINKEILIFPWARAYLHATTQPNTLIYLIDRLPDRESQFKWVGTITPIESYLYKLKSRSDIQITQFSDVLPYEIGVLKEDAGHQYLQMRRAPNLQTVAELDQNIKKLAKGRIDLMLAAESSFVSAVESMKLNLDDFEKVFHVDELSVDGYLAFSQETPNLVVTQFQEALARIKARGEYETILKKYGLN